jgi:DNA-binding CsgD family transcriptional regulator
MRGRKGSASERGARKRFAVYPKTFIFFDRTTRTQRFEVKAQADGSIPADEAASLLAMHCVLRGQTPMDFGAMVAVGDELLSGLGRRATRLIDACVALQSIIHLSKRQHEVLRAVLQNLANKEIATQLHISVRTVKFHVSVLLAKFGAADRMGLVSKTAEMMSTGSISAKEVSVSPPAAGKSIREFPIRNSRESLLRLSSLERRSREQQNATERNTERRA